MEEELMAREPTPEPIPRLKHLKNRACFAYNYPLGAGTRRASFQRPRTAFPMHLGEGLVVYEKVRDRLYFGSRDPWVKLDEHGRETNEYCYTTDLEVYSCDEAISVPLVKRTKPMPADLKEYESAPVEDEDGYRWMEVLDNGLGQMLGRDMPDYELPSETVAFDPREERWIFKVGEDMWTTIASPDAQPDETAKTFSLNDVYIFWYCTHIKCPVRPKDHQVNSFLLLDEPDGVPIFRYPALPEDDE